MSGAVTPNVVHTGRSDDDPPLDMAVLRAQRAHVISRARAAANEAERDFWASEARKMDAIMEMEGEKQKRQEENVKRQLDQLLGARGAATHKQAEASLPRWQLLLALVLSLAALGAVIAAFFLA